MTPDERRLISDLFDRLRPTAGTAQDPEAAQLINESMKTQPHAAYFLVQSLLVQNEALNATNQRIQELEARVEAAESQAAPTPPPSFLGGLGRSFLGGAKNAPPRPSPWGPQQQGVYMQPAPPPPQQNPMGWGYGQPAAPDNNNNASSGGGFLQNALGTAAGVAGGVMLANSIQSLFSGHRMGGGFGGFGGGGYGQAGFGSSNSGYDSGYTPAGDTIVNNYYENPVTNDTGVVDASFYPQENNQPSDWNNVPDLPGDEDTGGGNESGGGSGGYDV